MNSPFMRDDAPKRETMADKPGAYLTPEALRSAMTELWNGRGTAELAGAAWDEVADAEERGWGEGDEYMADVIPDDWCGESMA